LLVLTTFGESHGPAVGAVLDGLPPGVPIDLGRVQAELDRRRPGASPLTSARREPDRLEVLSGLVEGRTLGTPVCALVRNEDARSGDYRDDAYRPSHADFTYDARYGVRAVAGGGRASARETVGRVLGGAFARQVLETLGPVQIVAWVDRVADLGPAVVDEEAVDQAAVDAQDCRCPDPALASAMTEAILAARKAGDTLGGVIKVVVRGLPAGLGSPVFDKLDARLGAALLSLPAAKGVEVGSGYGGARQTGRAHNDRFIPDPTRGIATATNRSGGVQGGLSNGMPLVATVAFKPVATIFHPQETVDRAGQPVVLRSRGRHDPCVLPRAVVMVEAMVALVLLDEWLCWRGQVGAPPPVPLLRPG
jgi:chorismate synthase